VPDSQRPVSSVGPVAGVARSLGSARDESLALELLQRRQGIAPRPRRLECEAARKPVGNRGEVLRSVQHVPDAARGGVQANHRAGPVIEHDRHVVEDLRECGERAGVVVGDGGTLVFRGEVHGDPAVSRCLIDDLPFGSAARLPGIAGPP
jgi:hypothetical protein